MRYPAFLVMRILLCALLSVAAFGQGPKLPADVDPESYSRLPHAQIVRDRAVGRETRIVQKDPVCRIRRIDRGVGKYLSFPTEPIIQCEIRRDLETILRKESEVLILDR